MRLAGAIVMRAFYSTACAVFTRADNTPAATSMTWSGTCYLKLVAEIHFAGDALIQASSQICNAYGLLVYLMCIDGAFCLSLSFMFDPLQC
jgi:hypothetical protein